MIKPSNDFIEELANGNRNYILTTNLYTSDASYILTNSELWSNSYFVEDAISADDTFDVGTAIINKFNISINNIEEDFSDINFTNAVLIPSVGLLLSNTGQVETYQKGIFIVDDCKWDGSLIKLSCLDTMEVFDRAYNTDLTFPATLLEIVEDACDKCGITLNDVKYPIAPEGFVNDDYTVAEMPTKENLTYREVISWCAQIAGGFARVDRLGHLEIKWFDTEELASLFDVESEEDFDSEDAHLISSVFGSDVAVDATEIAGVNIIYAVKEDDEVKVHTKSAGDVSKFKITITDNDFITTDNEAELVATTIENNVLGMKFYRADITHISNPCIEAGDVGVVRNFRGRFYPILISRTKFGASVSQTSHSNAETVSKNTSYRDSFSFNIDTSGFNINIPTDLLVITGIDGFEYAIYIDIDTGSLLTVKVPDHIYFYKTGTTMYYVGELIDNSSAEIHAVYPDGTEIDITNECVFTPATGDPVPTDADTFEIVATWTFTPGVSNNNNDNGGGGS